MIVENMRALLCHWSSLYSRVVLQLLHFLVRQQLLPSMLLYSLLAAHMHTQYMLASSNVGRAVFFWVTRVGLGLLLSLLR